MVNSIGKNPEPVCLRYHLCHILSWPSALSEAQESLSFGRFPHDCRQWLILSDSLISEKSQLLAYMNAQLVKGSSMELGSML